MSQQEFEPREQRMDDEMYRPRYPYGQYQEAQPKDEPPGAYDVPGEQGGYQGRSAQAPWWARPQPRQFNQAGFVALAAIIILIVLIMGGLGIAGVVLGSLLHLLGVILGAIFALLIFVFLLVFLVFMVIWRAVGRTIGAPWMYDRRARHDMRRNRHRAARRYWRRPGYW